MWDEAPGGDHPCPGDVPSSLAVDVVVLSWNDGDLARRAAASALRSAGVRARVHLVDNGSAEPLTPGTELGGAGTLVHRSPRNLGVAAGRNLGASLGSAPLVCFLDSDAVLEPDCLHALASAMAADPSVAVAAPVFAGHRPEQTAGRAPTLWRKAARGLGLTDAYAGAVRDGRPQWDVDFAIGACQLVRRDVFEHLGGFDERYFYGPEDVDLCLRAKADGRRVVQVGRACCHHRARRSSRRLWTRNGFRHGLAVLRHLWVHRRVAARRPGAERGAAPRLTGARR